MNSSARATIALLLISSSVAEADDPEKENTGSVTDRNGTRPIEGMDVLADDKPGSARTVDRPGPEGPRGAGANGSVTPSAPSPTPQPPRPPPPPQVVAAAGVELPAAIAPHLSSIALAYQTLSGNATALVASSGKRSAGKTAKMIADAVARDLRAGRTTLPSLDGRGAGAASAVMQIRALYASPDTASVAPADLVHKIEGILSTELAAGRPFSRHMTDDAVDFSVKGLTVAQKVALITAVLETPTGRVLIEGPENERKAAYELIRRVSNPQRVRFKSSDESHFHVDFAMLDMADSTPDRRLAFDNRSGLVVDAPILVPEFTMVATRRLDVLPYIEDPTVFPPARVPNPDANVALRFAVKAQGAAASDPTAPGWTMSSREFGEYDCVFDPGERQMWSFTLECNARTSNSDAMSKALVIVPDFSRSEDVYVTFGTSGDGGRYFAVGAASGPIIARMAD